MSRSHNGDVPSAPIRLLEINETEYNINSTLWLNASDFEKKYFILYIIRSLSRIDVSFSAVVNHPCCFASETRICIRTAQDNIIIRKRWAPPMSMSFMPHPPAHSLYKNIRFLNIFNTSNVCYTYFGYPVVIVTIFISTFVDTSSTYIVHVLLNNSVHSIFHKHLSHKIYQIKCFDIFLSTASFKSISLNRFSTPGHDRSRAPRPLEHGTGLGVLLADGWRVPGNHRCCCSNSSVYTTRVVYIDESIIIIF